MTTSFLIDHLVLPLILLSSCHIILFVPLLLGLDLLFSHLPDFCRFPQKSSRIAVFTEIWADSTRRIRTPDYDAFDFFTGGSSMCKLVKKQAKPSHAPVTWLARCEGACWVAWLATACKALGSSELSLAWVRKLGCSMYDRLSAHTNLYIFLILRA